MKRAAQMKQEQEELAFDRQMLEQLLAQTSADQQQQSQRKVGRVISCGRRIRVVRGLGGPMGWVGSTFFSFWWVGLGWIHYSKSTKILKGLR